RVKPWPKEYLATFMEISDDPTVYHAMNGPTEFHVVGTLKDWSVEPHLPDIAVPTLVISGAHDEATPATVRPFQELIPDVRWEIFPEPGRRPHLAEPECFHPTLVEYLKGRDSWGNF